MRSDQKNPLHPIDIDNYPKLFDYVLTAKGLVYFQTLKRKSILGQEMILDEYNKLWLFYICYIITNRNPKEDLKNKLLIVNNHQYLLGLYRQHIDYVKENFNSK